MTEKETQMKGWLVVLAASLFFFYEFSQLTMFNTISSDIMQAFDITGTKFGALAAGYFYANVIFLFPAGILLDRYSTRKLILGGLSLCIAATLLLSFAYNYWLALFARFLIGTAGSLCFLSVSRLASRWIAPSRLALAIGIVVTIAMLGGFVAQTPLSFLVASLGWRKALWAYAGVGVIILAIIYWQVSDYPPNYQQQHQENLRKLNENGFWYSIALTLKNMQNWFAGLYTSFLNLAVFLIGSSFGTLFLMQARHFTETQSSFISSMIFLGTIFGSPLIGAYSDRAGSRKQPMLICAIISLLLISLFLYIDNISFIVSCVLIFLVGFFTSAQIISYPLIAESNSGTITSSAIGIASVLIMGGGAVFEPLFGWLLNLGWDHTMQGEMAIYSAADFHRALLILPITMIISIVLTFFLRETHCRQLVK